MIGIGLVNLINLNSLPMICLSGGNGNATIDPDPPAPRARTLLS